MISRLIVILGLRLLCVVRVFGAIAVHHRLLLKIFLKDQLVPYANKTLKREKPVLPAMVTPLHVLNLSSKVVTSKMASFSDKHPVDKLVELFPKLEMVSVVKLCDNRLTDADIDDVMAFLAAVRIPGIWVNPWATL